MWTMHKVTDHHAIIPTEQFVQLDHMTNEERKIYDMVVRRFLAVLSPACEYEETSTKRQDRPRRCLRAKGNVIRSGRLERKYMRLASKIQMSEEADEERLTFTQNALPNVHKGRETASKQH